MSCEIIYLDQHRRQRNSFAVACDELRRKWRERHGDALLGDIECALCEDGITVIFFADYSADEPVTAKFQFSEPIDDESFNPQAYIDVLLMAGRVAPGQRR
jgi:hypothetical protein